MATSWVKRSRTERMSNGSAIAGPMSFNSGVFTHALAKLAIEKRTEREKVALVEALLLSRMSGNAKRAEAKLIEFKQLRHKIIRDHWNKAIHQVIIQYNIPDRVKKKQAMADTRQEEVEEQQQRLKSSIKHQQRKVDTQVRFNLQESSGFQPNSLHSNQPSIPTCQVHVPGHSMSRGLSGRVRPGNPQFMHQQPSSYQSQQIPQYHTRLAPSAISQPFIPIGRLHTVPRLQPELSPGGAALHRTATLNRQAPAGPTFGSLEERVAYSAASNGSALISGLARPTPQHDCGPFPSAATQQPQSTATAHRPSEHRTAASQSSCPTESSQASSIRPPERPPSHLRAASSASHSNRSQPAAASRPTFHAPASSHATQHDIAATISNGKHSSSHRHAARGPTATPSCTTESSSDAGHIGINPHMDSRAPRPPGHHHHQPTPRPTNIRPPHRYPPPSSAVSSVGMCSDATESSVSLTHVQAPQKLGVQHCDSQRGSSRSVGAADGRSSAGGVQAWQGHSASQWRQNSNVGSSMSHKPHSREVWGTPQQRYNNDAGAAAAAAGRSAMALSSPWTSRSHGVQGGRSSGSVGSSSRPSVGRSDAPEQQMRQRLAAQTTLGLHVRAGEAVHQAGAGVTSGRQVGSQCGVGGAHMTSAAGRASTVGRHARAMNGVASEWACRERSSQKVQLSSAAVGHVGGNHGGNGSFEGASRGSETTESSDDEA